jgi:pimeloyl-ACP methyl ester carboxylesterase
MRLFSLLLGLLFLAACSSDDPAKKTADTLPQVQASPLVAGNFNELSCTADPSNIFTLYLPQGYTPEKRWPVIIFFDAHANGHLPLEKYKALADKWGYVFVGSNSSKNGLSGDRAMQIGNTLIDEVTKLLKVDPRSIVLCGFSGGARVASALLAERNELKGVICNSAAPQRLPQGKMFVGLAGLGDMNYLEMKKFSGASTGNDLLVFDGKHEWAPAQIFEDALLIFGCYSTGGTLRPDSAMAAALAENIISQSDSMKGTSCLLAKNLLETGRRHTTQFGVAAELNKRLENLKGSACVRTDENAWKAAEEKETALQQFLSESLLTRDTTWWRENAAQYFEFAKPGAEKFMRERLRGYVSLTCYSYSNQAIQMKNFHAGEKMVKLYSIVDPSNSEWAYLQAVLYVNLGMSDYVIPSLQQAVALGFNDRERLQNDPAFTSLHGTPAFNELFARIK